MNIDTMEPGMLVVLKGMVQCDRVFIRDFKQYRCGKKYGDIGLCTRCRTICNVKSSKNGKPFLVNHTDKNFHRIYQHDGARCNTPKQLVVPLDVHTDMTRQISHEQKRWDIPEVPIETATDSGIDIIE